MRIALAAFLASLPLTGCPASAAEAPFDAGLSRLAEILGSLHFLRNLCGEAGTAWRDEAQRLIETGPPPAERKARLVASFNHGYRTLADTYVTCTPAAAQAIGLYVKEGEALSRDIATRFGN